MQNKLFLTLIVLFLGVTLTTQGATGDVVTPGASTAVFVPVAVLVGFVVRCHRKGLPFRSPKS